VTAPALGAVVVGAGDMGARHALHWRDAGARLVGVFDPLRPRSEALAAEHDCLALDSLGEVLERDDVHVVSVCTPTFLHAHYTVAALRRGKHVLCEKPAALTLAEALAMKEAEDQGSALLRVGFMRRFDPAAHQILRWGGAIAEPVMAQATIAAGVRPKLLMHDAAANGGPIIDMCCHVFDQWAMLFGEGPVKVRAHGYTFSKDRPELASIELKALDSAHITLAYPGGGVGQVQVSWGLPRWNRPAGAPHLHGSRRADLRGLAQRGGPARCKRHDPLERSGDRPVGC
jgi:predicted dehydrogenase